MNRQSCRRIRTPRRPESACSGAPAWPGSSGETNRMTTQIGDGLRPWKELCMERSHAAMLPASSSSIWTRMISSNDASALKPSASARRGSKRLRPAGDDVDHQRIRLAADTRRDLVAGDAPQRGDLFGDRATNAGHGEIDARAELLLRPIPRRESESRPRRADWHASAERSRRPAAPPPSPASGSRMIERKNPTPPCWASPAAPRCSAT